MKLRALRLAIIDDFTGLLSGVGSALMGAVSKYAPTVIKWLGGGVKSAIDYFSP
jgi:hypothetical protein